MATYRRVWTERLDKKLRRLEGLLGLGEPTEEQIWAFWANWFALLAHTIYPFEQLDGWRDLLKTISEGGGPACETETYDDLIRWFYDLAFPFLPERQHKEIRQKTRELWRSALAGELEPMEPTELWLGALL